MPGAEITQNHFRSRKNSHIIALEHQASIISADQPAEDILRAIRRQDAVSIACHPHHRTTRRIEIGTCYLWEHRERLVDLVDVWEAANRDDLFSVTSLKHYPYIANSDFHKPKHLYSWKTLLRCDKTWDAVARSAARERGRRVDALSQRIVGGVTPGSRVGHILVNTANPVLHLHSSRARGAHAQEDRCGTAGGLGDHSRLSRQRRHRGGARFRIRANLSSFRGDRHQRRIS